MAPAVAAHGRLRAMLVPPDGVGVGVAVAATVPVGVATVPLDVQMTPPGKLLATCQVHVPLLSTSAACAVLAELMVDVHVFHVPAGQAQVAKLAVPPMANASV